MRTGTILDAACATAVAIRSAMNSKKRMSKTSWKAHAPHDGVE